MPAHCGFIWFREDMDTGSVIYAANLRVQYSSEFYCCPSRLCVGRWIEIFIEKLLPLSHRFLILREQCLDICESKGQGADTCPGLLLERLMVHTADVFSVQKIEKIPHYFTIYVYRENSFKHFQINCKADDHSAAINWYKAFLIFQKRDSNWLNCIINMYTAQNVDSLC